MLDTSFRRKVEAFVEERIAEFHSDRALNLEKLKLDSVLLAKNPYLFRAKNFLTADDFIHALLGARLSSSEEGMFGVFMEDLAVFVSEQRCNGRKSSAEGIDLELEREGTRYLIAVKSGKNWGNSSQHKKLRENFQTAVKVLRQNRRSGNIQPTLGICYGRFQTRNNGAFLHIGGQSFWQLISGESELYKDIIEPLGYRAKEFNDAFQETLSKVHNKMVRGFLNDYCLETGAIDWKLLVERVSGNLEP